MVDKEKYEEYRKNPWNWVISFKDWLEKVGIPNQTKEK